MTFLKPRGGPRRNSRWPDFLIVLASCFLFQPVSLRAQELSGAAARELQVAALADTTAWRLLTSLTVDVGPRMAGTEGDRSAVAWAQRQMQALGFDRVWLEPVEFPLWHRGSESVAIVAPRRQALVAAALGGSPGTNGPLRAEVVHFASLAELEAADEASIKGRIAFISERMERSQSGSGYSRVVPGRSQGPAVAAAKGAAALVIRSVGTSKDRFAHTGTISSASSSRLVPAAALSGTDADLLLGLLQTQGRVELELNLDCGFDGMGSSHNVIGEFSGSSEEAGFVLVGGHLDSWDLGTGAQDNGAGVATTMAAAALVARQATELRRGIRVVLFANEEQGVYGGKAYAREHAAELGRHLLGAESDLGSGRIYQFRYRVLPAAAPVMQDLAAVLAPLGIPLQPDLPATGGADLGEMVALGMPVLDLNHDASRYFDVHHSANDTLDQVDPADLAFNVAAFATFIRFAVASDIRFGPLPATPR